MLDILLDEEVAAPAFVADDGPRAGRKRIGCACVLKFEALHPANFTARADRAVRLDRELARRVAVVSTISTRREAA